jgi:hypothetical protein
VLELLRAMEDVDQRLLEEFERMSGMSGTVAGNRN